MSQTTTPLDEVETYLARFVAYPSEAARVAHALWIAHTHRMGTWDSTPRIAFLSPEPGSGKSRALEVSELLVPRPVHAVNTTPAYLFRKVADTHGKPTILYDEIDTVFGPKAKDNEDIRGMLNAGHRKGAVAGRCVVRGKLVETEELDAYCAVALAGLDDLPDTLMSRSIVVRMRRRAPDEIIEPFRLREQQADGDRLRSDLAAWVTQAVKPGLWPEMPEEVSDRSADVWEALLMVADAAGGDWPKRAREAAVQFVLASKSGASSLGIRLLTDLKAIFGNADHLFTGTIIERLLAMDMSPWADIKGKPLDARSLAFRLGRYEVKSQTVREGSQTGMGYRRVDLADVWARYVPDEDSSNTSNTSDGTGNAMTCDSEIVLDVLDVRPDGLADVLVEGRNFPKADPTTEDQVSGHHTDPVDPGHPSPENSNTSNTPTHSGRIINYYEMALAAERAS
jgi:hypothetical protein